MDLLSVLRRNQMRAYDKALAKTKDRLVDSLIEYSQRNVDSRYSVHIPVPKGLKTRMLRELRAFIEDELRLRVSFIKPSNSDETRFKIRIEWDLHEIDHQISTLLNPSTERAAKSPEAAAATTDDGRWARPKLTVKVTAEVNGTWTTAAEFKVPPEAPVLALYDSVKRTLRVPRESALLLYSANGERHRYMSRIVRNVDLYFDGLEREYNVLAVVFPRRYLKLNRSYIKGRIIMMPGRDTPIGFQNLLQWPVVVTYSDPRATAKTILHKMKKIHTTWKSFYSGGLRFKHNGTNMRDSVILDPRNLGTYALIHCYPIMEDDLVQRDDNSSACESEECKEDCEDAQSSSVSARRAAAAPRCAPVLTHHTRARARTHASSLCRPRRARSPPRPPTRNPRKPRHARSPPRPPTRNPRRAQSPPRPPFRSQRRP